MVGADEQHDFPFCPITDAVDITEMMEKKTIWPTNQSTSTSIQSRKFALKLNSR